MGNQINWEIVDYSRRGDDHDSGYKYLDFGDMDNANDEPTYANIYNKIVSALPQK